MSSLDDTQEVVESTFVEEDHSHAGRHFPGLQAPMHFDSVTIRIETRGRVREVPVNTGGSLFVSAEEVTVKDTQGNLVTRLPTANVCTAAQTCCDVTVTSAHAGTEIAYVFRFPAVQLAQDAVESLQAVATASVHQTGTVQDADASNQAVTSPPKAAIGPQFRSSVQEAVVSSNQAVTSPQKVVLGQEPRTTAVTSAQEAVTRSVLGRESGKAAVTSVQEAVTSNQAVTSPHISVLGQKVHADSPVQEIDPTTKETILEAEQMIQAVAANNCAKVPSDALDPGNAVTPEKLVEPACKANRARGFCGICDGCLRHDDCGDCHFCKDKPKFGGRNTLRQKCMLKKCQASVKSSIQSHASEERSADSIAVDVFNTFSYPARKSFQKSLNAYVAQKSTVKRCEEKDTTKLGHASASKAGQVLPLPPSIAAEVDDLLATHRAQIDEYKQFLLKTDMFKQHS